MPSVILTQRIGNDRQIVVRQADACLFVCHLTLAAAAMLGHLS
jgi:hypothetical protein